MEEVKPCPFCGSDDIRFDYYKLYHSPTGEVWTMCCYNCGAQFPNMYKKEYLLNLWNRRVSSNGDNRK